MPHLLINKRTPILVLAPDVVIPDAEAEHGARDKDAVIHVLGRRRRFGGPEAPEEHEDDVDACERVVERAPHARDAPGAPDQART